MARAFRFLLVVLVFAGAGFGIWTYDRYTRPGPLAQEAMVVIPKGAGLDGIARRLAAAHVIDDPKFFGTIMRVMRREHRLRAGEYAFTPGMSMRQAAERIFSGTTVKRRLTIAEGLTTQQIFALVRAAEGLTGEVPPLANEGSLLPETYFYSYGDTRTSLVGRMREAMREALDELWSRQGRTGTLKNKREAVILASIIEKETGLAEERPEVSSVFNNRLRLGMRLQSDPTVVYGLTNGRGPMQRRLTYADLEKPTPYNTYRIGGLPPGPIANPGRASIAAALNPAKTRYLYFVADGTGGHVFARTHSEHKRNVARWRRLQRKRMRAAGG